MAKLYIANCKKQNEYFSYRAAENGQLMSQTIPAGGQLQIYRDEVLDVLKNIVEQHRMYGLVHVSEIDRTKPFINLCYQFDKPVTQDQIMHGIEHNSAVLKEAGEEYLKKSAVAISNGLEKAAEASDNGSKIGDVSLELVEEAQPGDHSPKMSSTVEVSKGIEKKRGRK